MQYIVVLSLFMLVALTSRLLLHRRARRRYDTVALRAQLLRMARHPRVADCLIDGVRRGHPDLTEAACLERAIERLRNAPHR